MSDEVLSDGQGALNTGAPPTETGGWMESIPEDLRGDASLADIKDVGSLAKSYIHAQKMIGSDKIAMPGADATEEEMGDFYNKLGRPSASDGYEIPTENMPAEVPVDNEFVGRFFEEAHRIGLNKQQAAALVRWNVEAQKQQSDDYGLVMDKEMADAEESMKREFGDAYEQNLTMAQEAAQQFGGDELINLLNETGLGNKPEIIKAFANIARAISNDEVIGSGGRKSFLTTPQEAISKIASKKQDPNFMAAYNDSNHIGHKDAVEEMGRLFSSAYPTEE